MGNRLLKGFLCLIILALGLINFCTVKENYQVNKINTTQKIMMLTFDDGPGEEDTEIIKILEEHKITATFFGVGVNYESYFRYEENSASASKRDKIIHDNIVQMIKDHDSLGNHSYTHNKYQGNAKKAYNEFESTNKLIEKIAAANGLTLKDSDIPIRMPYYQYFRGLGWVKEKLKNLYFVRGFLGCDWNGEKVGAATLIKRYTDAIGPGRIITCHTRSYAKKWLPKFIENAQKQGYKFCNFNNFGNDSTLDYHTYGKLVN